MPCRCAKPPSARRSSQDAGPHQLQRGLAGAERIHLARRPRCGAMLRSTLRRRHVSHPRRVSGRERGRGRLRVGTRRSTFPAEAAPAPNGLFCSTAAERCAPLFVALLWRDACSAAAQHAGRRRGGRRAAPPPQKEIRSRGGRPAAAPAPRCPAAPPRGRALVLSRPHLALFSPDRHPPGPTTQRRHPRRLTPPLGLLQAQSAGLTAAAPAQQRRLGPCISRAPAQLPAARHQVRAAGSTVRCVLS
jgi:hypothetical protein